MVVVPRASMEGFHMTIGTTNSSFPMAQALTEINKDIPIWTDPILLTRFSFSVPVFHTVFSHDWWRNVHTHCNNQYHLYFHRIVLWWRQRKSCIEIKLRLHMAYTLLSSSTARSCSNFYNFVFIYLVNCPSPRYNMLQLLFLNFFSFCVHGFSSPFLNIVILIDRSY